MHNNASDPAAEFFFSVIDKPGITDAEYHAAWLNFIEGPAFDEAKAHRDLIAARNKAALLANHDHGPRPPAPAMRMAA